MPYDFKPLEAKTAGAKEWLAREYKGLRTGRAAPAILDSIQVSAYGSLVPLKQVANVSVEDARTLRIAPWDASVVKDIERAIAAASLGLGTSSDGSSVRVSFPELTSERRQELVKVAKAKLEDARATVRVARDEAWREIQEKVRASALTEDDKFSLKDELQKRIDKVNEELEEAFDSKQKEMGV